MTITPRSLFRTLAIAEAITWTLLITGLILRGAAGLDVAVSIGGGIHGFVFLAYGVTAVLVAVNQRWSAGVSVLAIGSAIIPYATIPVEIWLARSGRLDGDWRKDSTADPRDKRFTDRILRLVLTRPLVFAIVAAVAVATVFSVLLTLGPPKLG